MLRPHHILPVLHVQHHIIVRDYPTAGFSTKVDFPCMKATKNKKCKHKQKT